MQGVLSKLYAGTIGEQDVKRIAQRNDTVPVYCWTAQVKGEKLLEILDYGAYSEKEREAEETCLLYTSSGYHGWHHSFWRTPKL